MKKRRWILLVALIIVAVCLLFLFIGDKNDDGIIHSSGEVEQSSDEEIVLPEEKLPENKSDATDEGHADGENNKKSESGEGACETANDKEGKENGDTNEDKQNEDELNVTGKDSETTSGKPIVLPEIQF